MFFSFGLFVAFLLELKNFLIGSSLQVTMAMIQSFFLQELPRWTLLSRCGETRTIASPFSAAPLTV